MKKLIQFFIHLPVKLVKFILHLPKNTVKFFRGWVWQISTFSLLLIVYLLFEFFTWLGNMRLMLPPIKLVARLLSKKLQQLMNFLCRYEENTISRISLIDLAIKNMKFKKSRAIITVGGMAIGIGAIVFLVSIGYGVNKLVIDRVARLEEMFQADIQPQPGSKVRITDESLSNFKNMSQISNALPLISLVARVNYQNSETDMAVYGVTSDYLKQSAIKPILGEVFTNNDIAHVMTDVDTQSLVATNASKTYALGETVSSVEFRLPATEWLRVREEPMTNGAVLGYVQNDGQALTGVEVAGERYQSNNKQGEKFIDANGQTLGSWLKSDFQLWIEESCDVETNQDCRDGKYVLQKDEADFPKKSTGYVAQIGEFVTASKPVSSQLSSVLGIQSDGFENELLSEDLYLDTLSDSEEDVLGTETLAAGNDEWIEIASESGILTQQTKETIPLGGQAQQVAVVNTAMLNVLGISTENALNTTFDASFVVVGDLLANNDTQIESVPSEYRIIGVVPDDNAPYFYVPFIDLRSLGVTNFSLARVVVKDKNELAKIRQQIEAMGYTTVSVADTVEEIDRLFGTIRSVLALLGMVALAVASLGMFNTLTVSLMERTREVGLMKAMGMKSGEIRELFLTESMLMGFFGGLFGIIFGFVGGKLVGVILSFFSVFKGQGFIDVSHIPSAFVLIVFILSLIVGVFTGIYPARRATKISALNALRYE